MLDVKSKWIFVGLGLAVVVYSVGAQASKRSARIVVIAGANEWSIRQDSKETLGELKAKVGEKASYCYVGDPNAVRPLLERLVGNQNRNVAPRGPVKIQSFNIRPEENRQVIDVKISPEKDPATPVFQVLIDRC